METFKRYLTQIINWYLFPYMVALLIVLPTVYFFSKNMYQYSDTWGGILIEAHGMIFDIIVIGILVTIISRRRENKLETQRYLDELDDYRGWSDSQEASHRVSGILRRLQKKNSSQGLDLRGYCLKGAVLQNAKLQQSEMYGANLEGVDLWQAKLQGGNFRYTNLIGADLRNTKLKGSQFWRANLNCSKLGLADLEGVGFQDAWLGNANMKYVNLKDSSVQLYQLKYVESLHNAIMPDGTSYNGEWQQAIDRAITPQEYLYRWPQYL